MTVIYQMYLLQTLFPICDLFSHSLNIAFPEAFNFNEVQLMNYLFPASCLWCGI